MGYENMVTKAGKKRYFKWRLNKLVEEASKNAKEYRILITSSTQDWKARLLEHPTAFIYVTRHGCFIQFLENGDITPPKLCKTIDEAIDETTSWLVERPFRWYIKWEKI